jgi:signal transduction histidine kinase
MLMPEIRWTHTHTLIAYGVLSSLYIFFSDQLVSVLVTDTELFARVSMIKGLGFIAVTVLFLGYLLRKERQRQKGIESLSEISKERGNLLFDNSTVAIWEEDFSKVRVALAKLRASGVQDLGSYLNDHPGVVEELVSLVEVLDVNQKSIDLVHATSKEDLLGPLDKNFLDQSKQTFIEELVAIDEGASHFEGEITGSTLDGEPIHLWLTMNIPPPDDPFDHIIVTMTEITQLKIIESEITSQKEQLRALTARLAEVEEDQRRNFAQELHDRVGQTLTAINININMIRSQLPENADQKIRTRIEDTQSLLDTASKQIRDVMGDLHPPVLNDYGLPETLKWYGDQIHQRTGLSFEVNTNGIKRLPRTVEFALFRIVQEAVNNVVKHAHATVVELSLHADDQAIELCVIDNGMGFSPTGEPGGWGLNIMRERAISIGGELNLETEPDQGTRITVLVPRAPDNIPNTAELSLN